MTSVKASQRAEQMVPLAEELWPMPPLSRLLCARGALQTGRGGAGEGALEADCFCLMRKPLPPARGGPPLTSYTLFGELLGVTSDPGSRAKGSRSLNDCDLCSSATPEPPLMEGPPAQRAEELEASGS